MNIYIESRLIRIGGLIILLVCNFILDIHAKDSNVVEVQSYRLTPKLNNIPANVTVINRKDIENDSAQNVAELLTHYGLHVEQTAGPGSLSSIYLRGADPNFTLVLINGVKVNDPTNSRGGSFDFSSLDIQTIERIEIIRGPLSSTYGSDALSGVINIITKEPEVSTNTTVNIVKGENGLHSLASTFSNQTDNFNFSVTGSYNDSGKQVSGTELKSQSGDLKGAWFFSDATHIKFHSRYYDSDGSSFPEDSGGSAFAMNREVDKRDVFEFMNSIELLHQLNKRLDLSFKGSLFHHEEDITSPGVAPGLRDPFGIPRNEADSEFTRYTFTASADYMLNQNTKSIFGANLEIEDGQTDGFLDFGGPLAPTSFKLNRSIYSIFTETQASLGRYVTLQTGLRFDMPEQFSDRLSPNVGLNFEVPNTQSNVRLNWGKAFKLPSFFALGNPIVGNENIKPETSETFELGIDTNLFNDKGQVNVTFFTQEFENIVDFDAGPPPKLVNRSKVNAKGMELAIALFPANKLSSRMFVNYTDTNIKGSEEELLNRPEWSGSFSLNWQVKNNISYNLNATYVDDVKDSSIPTGRVTLDDYTRVDVSAMWNAYTNLDLIFAVDNLFDTDYEETIGSSAAGIAARVQLRGNF